MIDFRVSQRGILYFFLSFFFLYILRFSFSFRAPASMSTSTDMRNSLVRSMLYSILMLLCTLHALLNNERVVEGILSEGCEDFESDEIIMIWKFSSFEGETEEQTVCMGKSVAKIP